MTVSLVRTALTWIVVAAMAGMMAGTIGLLVFVVLAIPGDPGQDGSFVSLGVTMVCWAWAMHFLWSRTRIR
jgi:hypothetical protein